MSTVLRRLDPPELRRLDPPLAELAALQKKAKTVGASIETLSAGIADARWGAVPDASSLLRDASLDGGSKRIFLPDRGTSRRPCSSSSSGGRCRSRGQAAVQRPHPRPHRQRATCHASPVASSGAAATAS